MARRGKRKAEAGGLRPVVVNPDLADVRERASTDFLFFRVHILGRKFLEGNKFQEDMTSFAESDTGGNVKLFRVPRGHGKTTLLIDDMIWAISKDPNERILYRGPTLTHCESVLAGLMEMVESCKALQQLFPDVWPKDPLNECPLWTRKSIRVERTIHNKNNTISLAGVEMGKTGSHYTRIYLDDQVTEDNYRSKQMRDKIWDATLASHALLDDMPDKRALMIYANTPWHQSDATMRLTSNECPFVNQVRLFERTVYLSGTLDASEGVIWPEVRDEQFIAIQREKGMKFFSPHYLMKPMAEGEHPFNKEKLHRYLLDYQVAEDGVCHWEHPLDREFYIHMAVDPNKNANEAADPAAIMVWAKDTQRHMWALYKKKLRGPTTAQLFAAMLATYEMWQPLSCMLEVGGKDDRFFYDLMQYLQRRGKSMHITKMTRGGRIGKGSKYGRITPMSSAVEDGMFHVPSDPTWTDFVEEVELFDETCEHDDMLDATADIFHKGRWPHEAIDKEDQPVEAVSATLLKSFGYKLFEDADPDDGLFVPSDGRLMV